MSNKPRDPSQGSIDQTENYENSFEGQQGYGVEFEESRFQNPELQEMPPSGRSGSYESGNEGGYGAGGRNASIEGAAKDSPSLPPDPEGQQGQGGQ